MEALQQATHARVLRTQAEVARLEQRTWKGVGIALATALVLALLTTAVIALRITRSLRRLSAATSAVAAGSFREPIPTGGRDEVGVLARSFNAMAARLRQHDEEKEEFFATLSHELRSPITSVREAAHLLADGVPGPLTAKQTRMVDIIRRSTDRLLRLVNQILDVSRLRAGVLPLERVPLDLDWLVGRAIDELRPQADEARVTLARERVGTRFTVVGDEDRLVQVVVNLLANAVRFTPVGGRVTVRLVDAGPECELQVEDTGVGIPARGAAARLRVVSPGASGQRRHRPGAGHRAGPGAGARWSGDRRVAGGQGQPLHGAPAPGPGRMSGLRRVIAGGALVVAVGGCASWPLVRTAQPMLERADRLAHEGAWEEAVAAYGEYLEQHPRAEEAPRAAASRDALRALITARAELSKAA